MDQFNINTINTQNNALTNKNNELREKNSSIFQQGQALKDAQGNNSALKNEVNDLARQNANMANQVSESQTSAMAARIQRNIAQEENEKLKNVLNRPLMDIISENERLRSAMEKQQALLEEWMLSQKAFKVLAFKYGQQQNISNEVYERDIELAKEQIKQGKKMAEIKLS